VVGAGAERISALFRPQRVKQGRGKLGKSSTQAVVAVSGWSMIYQTLSVSLVNAAE
jgi:hypothetical protein